MCFEMYCRAETEEVFLSAENPSFYRRKKNRSGKYKEIKTRRRIIFYKREESGDEKKYSKIFIMVIITMIMIMFMIFEYKK